MVLRLVPLPSAAARNVLLVLTMTKKALCRYPVASGAVPALRPCLALPLNLVADHFVPPVPGLNTALILPTRALLVKQVPTATS